MAQMMSALPIPQLMFRPPIESQALLITLHQQRPLLRPHPTTRLERCLQLHPHTLPTDQDRHCDSLLVSNQYFLLPIILQIDRPQTRRPRMIINALLQQPRFGNQGPDKGL